MGMVASGKRLDNQLENHHATVSMVMFSSYAKLPGGQNPRLKSMDMVENMVQ